MTEDQKARHREAQKKYLSKLKAQDAAYERTSRGIVDCRRVEKMPFAVDAKKQCDRCSEKAVGVLDGETLCEYHIKRR